MSWAGRNSNKLHHLHYLTHYLSCPHLKFSNHITFNINYLAQNYSILIFVLLPESLISHFTLSHVDSILSSSFLINSYHLGPTTCAKCRADVSLLAYSLLLLICSIPRCCPQFKFKSNLNYLFFTASLFSKIIELSGRTSQVHLQRRS